MGETELKNEGGNGRDSERGRNGEGEKWKENE